MIPRIGLPAQSPAWLTDYNRNVERAIDSTGLDARVSAIEGELMALAENAESMAVLLSSIERLTVTMAAAAQVQTDLLARIEALTRGRPDPRPDEEGSALINAYLSKEPR